MDVCETECKLKKFGLDHPNPRMFVKPQGEDTSVVYIVYRVVAAVYFGFVLVYSGVEFKYGSKWFIFFTYWGLAVLTLNVILQAVLVLGRHPSRRKYNKRDLPASDVDACTKMMPIILKIVWLLQNVTLSSAVMVTTIYWTAVYDGCQPNFISVSANAVNSIYVVCDMCVTGIPVRMLHFYQPFLFGVIYAIFSVSYWAVGGTNHEDKVYIYSILDYDNHPTTAAIWLLILIAGSVTAHFLVYYMYRLRICLYSCCAHANVQPPLPEVDTYQEIADERI